MDEVMFNAKERMTQELLVANTGHLLALGWSESAVVRHCEAVATEYFERLEKRVRERVK